ncbi:NPC intracellular cholesterol transporter 2 [Nephila pilipes]|uniref:NPC intracellular cholesterol transporter 2 n=1 Tax=Nephila pilipes TaxID=299642 RepID=A0A8X6K4H2_NEPPI|nr:NPC intracellular cholesterol transporter 2 [Nephila pilipes]
MFPNNLKIVFISICLITTLVNGIDDSDCGSTIASVHEVKVSGCEELDLCPLMRDNVTELEITFEVDSVVENMKASAFGDINDNNLFLPFLNMPQRNACVKSGLQCPLQPGQIYTYTSLIPVKSYYPLVRSNVKWQLWVGNEMILCVFIPSVIV